MLSLYQLDDQDTDYSLGLIELLLVRQRLAANVLLVVLPEVLIRVGSHLRERNVT